MLYIDIPLSARHARPYQQSWCQRSTRNSRVISKQVCPSLQTTQSQLTWTSSNNVAYMGVTAHWLDGSFGMHNKCLAVKPAPGSHTADLISSELTQVLEEWSIVQQDLHIVTDSGANVKKAMSLISGVLWRPCFAHTLRLCECA